MKSQEVAENSYIRNSNYFSNPGAVFWMVDLDIPIGKQGSMIIELGISTPSIFITPKNDKLECFFFFCLNT